MPETNKVPKVCKGKKKDKEKKSKEEEYILTTATVAMRTAHRASERWLMVNRAGGRRGRAREV